MVRKRAMLNDSGLVFSGKKFLFLPKEGVELQALQLSLPGLDLTALTSNAVLMQYRKRDVAELERWSKRSEV